MNLHGFRAVAQLLMQCSSADVYQAVDLFFTLCNGCRFDGPLFNHTISARFGCKIVEIVANRSKDAPLLAS